MAVAAVLAVGMVYPQAVRAQSLDELIEDARGFEQRVERLETQFLKPALLESRYKLETRFNDARVAFMLEDYDRASLLFVDVIRDPRIEEFASHREALYMLAESLYKRRNLLSAKRYYRKLVEKGPGEHYEDAVVRLLEVAAKSGDYENVDNLYQRLTQQREMSPAIEYMRGKTLYQNGEPQKAISFFNQAMEDPNYEYRSRYFKAICLVDSGDLSKAREIYRSLVQDVGSNDASERRILHLSYLALGRVAYEVGDYEQAIDHYQRLPRSSEYFDRALYELTWVLVSRKNYKQASRNADIFLYLSNPDPTFIPEIKLLKADLLLRLDRYDEATVAYNNVVEDFKPVRKNLNTFLNKRSNLRAFFQDLVDRELAGEDPDYLPETVQQWIEQSAQMDEVKKTVEDVAQLQRDIELPPPPAATPPAWPP